MRVNILERQGHRHARLMVTGSLTAAIAMMTCPSAAQAQSAQTLPQADQQSEVPLTAPASEGTRDIVVTGSRIVSSGFNAPTPTTMIGVDEIEGNAQPNIFNTIAQLPSLQGSSGSTVNTFSTSSGQQGLSSFSLRGLGPIRTLTLLDGQRVVGANVTGVPDISLFPQLLIKHLWR